MRTFLWLTGLAVVCVLVWFACSLHVGASVLALAAGAAVVPLIAAAVRPLEVDPVPFPPMFGGQLGNATEAENSDSVVLLDVTREDVG